jgi:hypothetical protein
VDAARLLGVAADRVLHAQRGVAGAHRVILMRERGAEQRHDAVAHDLIDRALVVVHGFHHAFEDGIEDLARLFRIAIGEQLHRALQIREQHRDLLALAFEGGLGSEDLLGEVLGRVGIRSRRRPDRASAARSLDRLEKLLAMAERDTQLLQIGIGEQAQGFEVDVVLGEDCTVLLQSEFAQPRQQRVHATRPRS